MNRLQENDHAIWELEYYDKGGSLAKATIVREDLNEETGFKTEGERNHAFVPGSYATIRPMEYKGRIDIDISQDKLDAFVMLCGFSDKEGNPITTAKLSEPNGPFWGHEALELEIPFSGHKFDTREVSDYFWFKVARESELFWFEDLQRPMTLAQVCMKGKKVLVESTGASLADRDKDVVEITKSCIAMPAEVLRLICDTFYYEYHEESTKEDFQTLVINQMILDQDEIGATDEKLADVFHHFKNASTRELDTYGLFVRAKRAGLLSYSQGFYMFKEHNYGATSREAMMKLKDDNYELSNKQLLMQLNKHQAKAQ